MQSILQQAKGDPAALQEHMKNPDVKTKVQKLIMAGTSIPIHSSLHIEMVTNLLSGVIKTR